MTNPNSEPMPILSLQSACDDTTALHIYQCERAELLATLKPIAGRIQTHVSYADTVIIKTLDDALTAAAQRDKVLADCETAKQSINEFSGGLIEKLFKLHRGWTGGRALFTEPLESAAKTLKEKIGQFEWEQEQIAESRRQKLQAEADEKARREREAAEKKARAAVKPETRQKYEEQAAAVVAPVIVVPVAKTGTKFQQRWKVQNVNLTEMGIPAGVQGWIEIKTTALERGKAANPMLIVPGVNFHQVLS